MLSTDSEFGVELNKEFFEARNVMFWTHGFSQNSPAEDGCSTALDFGKLTKTILSCGKSLNLLRLCQSKHLLCSIGAKFCPELRLVISPLQVKNSYIFPRLQ